MRHFDNMRRQHASIQEDIDFLVNEISKDINSINVTEVALRISRLAGKIKIHMLEEDKFLYPELLMSVDAEVKSMAKQYIDEMGDLSDEYTRFKTAYNTALKIQAKPDTFQIEAKKVINALMKRIDKEDNELYAFIQEKNL